MEDIFTNKKGKEGKVMKRKFALVMAVFMTVSSLPQGIIVNAAEETPEEVNAWISDESTANSEEVNEGEFSDGFTSEETVFSGENVLQETENSIFPEENQIIKMQLEKNYTAQVNDGENVWFSFEPEENGVYVFSSKGEYDTFGALYNADEIQLAMNDDNDDDYNFELSCELEAGERYYLETSLTETKTGSYEVNVSANDVQETIAEQAEKDFADDTNEISSDSDIQITSVELLLKSRYYVNIDRITPENIELKIIYEDQHSSEISADETDEYGNYFCVKIEPKETASDENNNFLTGGGIKLDSVGWYTVKVYLNDTDRLLAEKDIEVTAITPEGLDELKEGQTFLVSEGESYFAFSPETSGYYYLSEAPDHDTADIIDVQNNTVEALEYCSLDSGVNYVFHYVGEAGNLVIKRRPDLQSVSIKGDKKAVAGFSSAEDIFNWKLVGQYSDGKSYDIGYNSDFWNNYVSKILFDAAGREVTEDSELAAGDYTLEINIERGYGVQSARLPIHVYSWNELEGPTLQTGKHQSVKTWEKNDEDVFILFSYQPEEDGYYSFMPSMGTDWMKGIDESGAFLDNIENDRIDAVTEGYTVYLTKAQKYHFIVYVSYTENTSFIPMTVQKVSRKGIKNAVLNCDKTYYKNLDSYFSVLDFYLDVTYTDGTTKRIQGGAEGEEGESFSIRAENSNSNAMLSGSGIHWDDNGECVVKAYWKQQKDAIAETRIQIRDVNIDQIPKVKEGNAFHVKGENEAELFYFSPEHSGSYYFSGINSGYAISVYKYVNDRFYYVSDEADEDDEELEKGNVYIIRYKGKTPADIKIGVHSEPVSQGFTMELDKMYDGLVIGDDGEVSLSFTPTQTGVYELEVQPEDKNELKIEFSGDWMTEYSENSVRRILKKDQTYVYNITCEDGSYFGNHKFSARLTLLKDKTTAPINIELFDVSLPGRMGFEGLDQPEDLESLIIFDYDETKSNLKAIENVFHIGENTDRYGNKYTVTLEDISKDPDVKKEYRFKVTCGNLSKENTIVLYNPQKLEKITTGEKKQFNYGKKNTVNEERWCYSFTPEETGYYALNFDGNKKLKSLVGKVRGADGTDIYWNRNYEFENGIYGYYLEAGKTYYIKAGATSYGEGSTTLEVRKLEKIKITDMEIIQEPEDTYAVEGMVEPDFSDVKAKITYSDGTSEEIGEGKYCKNGEKFYCYIRSWHSSSYIVRYKVGSLREHRHYTLVKKEDLPVISEKMAQTIDFGKGMNTRIIVVQPGRSDKYQISVNSENDYSCYFIDEAGNQTGAADKLTALEEGQKYYVAVQASGKCEVALKTAECAHKYTWITDKAATCGEAGKKHEECTVCHAKKAPVEIPATGKHNYQKITDKAATCGAAGKQHEECTVCHAKKASVEIPATGKHNYQKITDKAATCGEAGKQHEECTVCHAKKASAEIPATGKHQFGNYKTVKEATVFEKGTQERECAVCGKKDIITVKKLSPQIKVSAKKLTVTAGKTVAGPKVTFAKGDSIVKWKSANTSIASVNKKGKITGKKAGKTKITVTLKSKKTATITVTVTKKKIPTTSLKVNKKTLQLKKGKNYQLKVTVKPAGTTDKLSYKSSNTKVATVSSSGKIKAKKKGKATITITSGKKKVTCKITVK